ncbi:MAG: PAS domain S-box protein, partial [bacterium]
ITLLTFYLVFQHSLYSVIHNIERNNTESSLSLARSVFLQEEIRWGDRAAEAAKSSNLLRAIRSGSFAMAGEWLDAHMQEMSPRPTAACVTTPAGAVIGSWGALPECQSVILTGTLQRLLPQTIGERKWQGVYRANEGYFILSIAAVTGSQDASEPGGFLLFFERIDSALLARLRPSSTLDVLFGFSRTGQEITPVISSTGGATRRIMPNQPPPLGKQLEREFDRDRILVWADLKQSTANDRLYIGVSVPRSISQVYERVFLRTLLMGALLGLAACGVLALLATQMFVGPIVQTTRRISQMGEADGSYGPLPVGRHDEFGALALSFNRLIAQLHQAQREVVIRNRDVTLLLTLAKAMSHSDTLDRKLGAALPLLLETFGLTGVAIYLLDESKKSFKLVAHKGLDAEWVRHNYEFPEEERLSRLITHPKDSNLAQGEAGLTSFCVSLGGSAHPIGVLWLPDAPQSSFTPGDLKLLNAIGQELGVAIQAHHLAQETSRLKEFNERIVQGLQEAILMEDENGLITFANRRVGELLGYSTDELIGRESIQLIAGEELEHVRAESAQRRLGENSVYESLVVTKFGDRLPVLVSSTA